MQHAFQKGFAFATSAARKNKKTGSLVRSGFLDHFGAPAYRARPTAKQQAFDKA
jgi:hypothetical protein